MKHFCILTRDEIVARSMPRDRRPVGDRGLIYQTGAERRRTIAALLAVQETREAELCAAPARTEL
jgi:hypothetical protein